MYIQLHTYKNTLHHRLPLFRLRPVPPKSVFPHHHRSSRQSHGAADGWCSRSTCTCKLELRHSWRLISKNVCLSFLFFSPVSWDVLFIVKCGWIYANQQQGLDVNLGTGSINHTPDWGELLGPWDWGGKGAWRDRNTSGYFKHFILQWSVGKPYMCVFPLRGL